MINKKVLKLALFLSVAFSLAAYSPPSYACALLPDRTTAKVPGSEDLNNSEAGRVKGIYSLTKVNGEFDPRILTFPFVEGVSVRVRWSKLEPEHKKYNWEYIDRILTQVSGTGKKVMIRVLPGVSSPVWIYEKGVSKVEFTPHRERKRVKFGNQVTTPLMWDKKYIGLWNEFIGAFAERYKDNSSIVMVHMSGPTVYSAEMHLLKSKDGKKLLRNAGYTRNKVVGAWRSVIDNYSQNFSKIMLSLNISLPLKKDGTLEEVLDYSISKLGNRLAVQGNWLKAKTKTGFLPYDLISALSEKDNEIEIGFQMAWSSKNSTESQGTIKESVSRGLKVNAGYFELYQVDILDENNKDYLIKLNSRLVDGD